MWSERRFSEYWLLESGSHIIMDGEILWKNGDLAKEIARVFVF